MSDEEREVTGNGGSRAITFVTSLVTTGVGLELMGAGGAGLLVAGVVAAGITYFSPELRGAVRGLIPTPTLEKKTLSKTGTTSRINWKKLTARDYQPEPEMPIAETLPDDDLTFFDDEPIIRQEDTALPSSGHVVASDMAIRLANNFVPHVDEIIGEGIVVFGGKGSGKTNVGALLAEKFSSFYVPFVIFDVEGDYASVVREVPNGYYAGAIGTGQGRERYIEVGTQDGLQAGYDILEQGCQVVFDLSSYDNDEDAADIMVQVIAGLTAWANNQPPEERVPCLIFLDEAAYWLPQKGVSYLSKETQKVLLDTYHTLATKGRKRGLTPILLTQRISEIEKSVMAQANVYFLGKQSLDNDLDRYEEYVKKSVATRDEIAAFGPGQFVVKLADGTQFVTRFNQRRSKHVSHTPKVNAAMERYARTHKRPALHATVPVTRSIPVAIPVMPPLPEKVTVQFTQPVQLPQKATELDRAVEAWKNGANSLRKLMTSLGITYYRAEQLHKQMKARRLID